MISNAKKILGENINDSEKIYSNEKRLHISDIELPVNFFKILLSNDGEKVENIDLSKVALHGNPFVFDKPFKLKNIGIPYSSKLELNDNTQFCFKNVSLENVSLGFLGQDNKVSKVENSTLKNVDSINFEKNVIFNNVNFDSIVSSEDIVARYIGFTYGLNTSRYECYSTIIIKIPPSKDGGVDFFD